MTGLIIGLAAAAVGLVAVVAARSWWRYWGPAAQGDAQTSSDRISDRTRRPRRPISGIRVAWILGAAGLGIGAVSLLVLLLVAPWVPVEPLAHVMFGVSAAAVGLWLLAGLVYVWATRGGS